MVGSFRVCSTGMIAYQSPPTIIKQRSTRLSGMRFKAGILSPVTIPHYGSHTWFGNPATVPLPMTSCVKTFVTHLANKHTAGTLCTHSRVSAITRNRNIISRTVGRLSKSNSLTDTFKAYIAYPGIYHTAQLQRHITAIIKPCIRGIRIIVPMMIIRSNSFPDKR